MRARAGVTAASGPSWACVLEGGERTWFAETFRPLGGNARWGGQGRRLGE